MNTQTNTDALGGNPATDAIPPGLKRQSKSELRDAAAKIAKTHSAKVVPAAKTAKQVKTDETKAAKQPKAKAAKQPKAHVPANITSTPDNPSKSIVPVRFKERYKAHGGTNGDNVALALKHAVTVRNKDGRETTDWSLLRRIADDNGLDMADYDRLNNGQKRMNVGNRLRGMIKAGTTVNIMGKRIATLKPAVVEQAAA